MAVSKRLRFEVLRRDGFACRYCHATNIELTVDHVVPVSLGGRDEPSNLVASCMDCNSGKSASSPEAPLVDEVKDTARLWAKAIALAADFHRDALFSTETGIERFRDEWLTMRDRNRHPAELPIEWEFSIQTFMERGLCPDEDLIPLARRAFRNPRVLYWEKWRYFCGCCWRTIEQREQDAAHMIDAGYVD